MKACLHEGRSSRLHTFFKLSFLKNLQHFTGKHLCWSLLLIKLWALRTATLLKKTPAPVKLLRTSFITKYFRWMLLDGVSEGANLVKILEDFRFNIFGINHRCFRKILIDAIVETFTVSLVVYISSQSQHLRLLTCAFFVTNLPAVAHLYLIKVLISRV